MLLGAWSEGVWCGDRMGVGGGRQKCAGQMCVAIRYC